MREGSQLCLNVALCHIPTRANRARMKFMSTARCLRSHIPGYPTQLSEMSLTSGPKFHNPQVLSIQTCQHAHTRLNYPDVCMNGGLVRHVVEAIYVIHWQC